MQSWDYRNTRMGVFSTCVSDNYCQQVICVQSWPEFGGTSSDSYSLLFVSFCWSNNTVCIITLCINFYSLSVLCCVTTHRDALTLLPDVEIQQVWHQFATVMGRGCVLLKFSQTFRQSFTCLQLSERQSPRNVYEIIPSGVEKSYSSSVTHSVIVWGNERIKKWGREDAGISTDEWERSFLPVRRPSYSTSSLPKTILLPYELDQAVTDWPDSYVFISF